MENRSRIHRGWRKENALPGFRGHVTPGQRNVQKNVNINLFVDTGSHTVVSRRWEDPAVPAPNHSRATVCGGPRVAFVGHRGVQSQRPSLVQTNLPCPDWPFQDVTGSVFNARQQSNLESKLQRCRSENVTRPGDPDPLSATDLGPSHPGLHRVALKGNSPNDSSDGSRYQSQTPSRGLGLRDLSHPCNDPCKRRLGDKDRCALNRPPGHPSVSERSGGAHKDSFSSAKSSIIPSAGSFLHDCRPPPNCSCQEVDSSSPGPPLTLDLLNASFPCKSEASSLAFQALLRSSQTSADLHSSIQQFKTEAAQMGALGSFPWDSKAAPLPYRSCFDPGVTTSALLSAPEESCARQASVKWQAPLARDWGLRSAMGTLGDANSIPVGFGCKNTGLYRHPMEALDQCWPTAAHSSLDSTSLAFEAKEDYSNPSICYRGCCSGFQEVPEGKTTCHLPKSHYHHQRIPNPEDRSSRLFSCPKLGGKDFPLGLPSLDGLEVALETLCAGTPVNKGVAMYDTQRDVHLTVGLPRSPRIAPVRHFGNSSEELGFCEPWREPVGIGETPVIAYAMDDYAPFLPPYKPSPFRIIARNRDHPRLAGGTDGAGVAIVERLPMGSHHSPCEDNGQFEDSSSGDLSTKPPHLEGQHQVEDARPAEALERGQGSTDRQRVRPASRQMDPLLEKSFGAWRDLVFEKKAAAQALYRRQLLRKGLGALKWALQLRDVEVGIAQRSCALAVLATSFRRWQAATARKQKERGGPQAAAPHSQGVPAPPGEEGVLKGPAWCQLSAEQLKGAAQYSRAEGNLWLQLHRTQGVAELCAKAQAVRDVRRLAAFRLWHLQKERQEEEEAQVQEALAILEARRLRSAFRVWRFRSLASRQVLPLTARMQSRRISRCFKAWRSFAEREAQSRRCLEHQRARSVGLCFHQWALMTQVRERARKSLLELFALKRRKLHGLNTPESEMCWNVAKWPEWNRADTLEGLYHLLRLQAAFQIWVVRWREHQLANVFRRVLEQRQLRESLRWWHWKALRLDHLACCNPKDLTEEPLLASLDLEESSLSSGFHSNAPALPVSSPFIKENSPGSSSQTSISSLGTVEDSGHHPQSDSPSLRPSPGPEDVAGVSTEVHIQASSPLTNCCCVGENGFLRDGFQSLGFLSPSGQIQPIVPSSVWDGVQARGQKTEWQLLARCFEIWSAQTRQNLKARQHHSHTLLARFFTRWAVAVARAAAQHAALVRLEHAQQQRLLASSFEKWRAESARVVQRQGEAEGQRRPSGQGAAWRRWRRAACRARGMDSVERACNVWTRAAAFALCARQRSSLVGARKFLKTPLSWTAARGCRGKRLRPSLAPDSRLTCSSFRVWLTMYRSQSRTLEHLPGAGSAATQAQIRGSSTAVDYRRGLGRKYLRRWRDNVRVRRFQDAWEMRQLVKSWLLWKDACTTALGVQALKARHRLVQWSWQRWRRRCLQSWVAERFLEAAERRLLERVFERWQRLAVLRTEGKVDS